VKKTGWQRKMDRMNEIYREHLDYDPDTGVIVWKKKPFRSHITIDHEAGTVNHQGYRQIGLRGKIKFSHIVAWFLHYDEWPLAHIDHINGIKDDNRICNLRVVTHRENHHNLSIHRDGKLVGTTSVKRKNEIKWQSNIQVNGKEYHLGLFPSEKEAHESYMRVYNADDMMAEIHKIRPTLKGNCL